jgi:hypothetical protein
MALTTTILHDLGVGAERVIGLLEGFQRGLPVALHDRRAPRPDAVILQPVEIERAGDRRQIVLQRGPFPGLAHEDEAAPCADRRLGQAQLFLGDAGEVGLVEDMAVLAVERPAPAMEGAGELGEVAAALGELGAAMEAGVEIGLDRARGGARHQDRLVAHLIFEIVAGIGDLLLAAGDLPGEGPEPLGFEGDMLGADVAGGVDPVDRHFSPFGIRHRFELVLFHRASPNAFAKLGRSSRHPRRDPA